jgi:outer membrane protein assembly factor BamA
MRKVHIYIIKAVLGSLILINGFAAAQDNILLRHIRIHGNDLAAQETVLRVMGIAEGKVMPAGWPDESLKSLVSWYHQRGYWLARIDSISERYSKEENYLDIEMWIQEGGPLQVGNISISNRIEDYKPVLLRLMECRTGRLFDPVILKQDIEVILGFLENNGHPLGTVSISSLSMCQENGHPRIDVTLQIDEGVFVYLDSLSVEGNLVTRKHVALREARLKTGSIYRHKDILTACENIRKLGFFKDVAEPEVVFIRDRAVATIKVKEGNTNTMDGVLGYSPPSGDKEKGYFTGRLQFTFRNLLGTGRFLEAYWEKKDEYSQVMRFGYEEPWLMGWPVHAGGRFQQEIRDTTYIEREWKFFVRFVPWASFSLCLEAGQKEVLPDSVGSVLYDLPRSKSWLLSAGMDYNTLDDLLNPRKGVRYHTLLTLGRKENVGPDFLLGQGSWERRVNTRRIQVDAEAALELFRHQVLYVGLHGMEVKTGDEFVTLSDQIRFGGAQTLRGYREDAFRGSLVAWANCEYRYLPGRRSRVFVFLDSGVFQSRERDTGMKRSVKIGYGMGIRLETRLGMIGIDYGIGEGDSMLRGKIHVRLINQF